MTTLALTQNIDSARLPALYENATKALAECSRIDECQEWANKAEAIASYARQAKNEQMEKMAMRIRARAIRRCGELLKQIPPSKGGRPKTHPATEASFDSPLSDTTPSRSEMASEAGLSKRQKETALQVASIPAPAFGQAVESENPPTITKLAEAGKAPAPPKAPVIEIRPLVDLGTIPPADYARATEARGTLKRFAEFCRNNEPMRIAKAFQAHEIAEMRRCVSVVDSWMDRFVTNLEG